MAVCDGNAEVDHRLLGYRQPITAICGEDLLHAHAAASMGFDLEVLGGLPVAGIVGVQVYPVQPLPTGVGGGDELRVQALWQSVRAAPA